MNNNIESLLNLNLGDVDTRKPILAANQYNLKIVDVQLVDSSDQTSKNIQVQLATLEPHETESGEQVGEGFRLFDVMSLKDSAMEMTTRKLAQLHQSALGKGAAGSFAQMHEAYKGRVVSAKVKVKPEKDGYERGNAISEYVVADA